MARTTAAEVRQIMDNLTTDAMSTTDVDSYISGANALVTKILGDDTDIGSVLMEDIERWFTAHMIACTRHRTTTEEKLGDGAVKYTGVFKEQLSSTPYGQMVLQLDITGKMANIGKKGAGMYAIKSFD
jgi:hypothetical protein